MKVELSRFRVRQGKSARVDDWMNMLNANLADNLEGLAREQMKLEVIFREIIDGQEYLYWFSVQGEAGEPLQTSTFAVDHQHMAFHNECIEAEYGMRAAQPQAIMVPEHVAQAMGWPDPPAAVVNSSGAS